MSVEDQFSGGEEHLSPGDDTANHGEATADGLTGGPE
jgi:hypothetical protein